MSLTKDGTLNSEKPKNENEIINRLHKRYENYKKDFMIKCPACNNDEYIFAFDRYKFHYVQCVKCKSLYVQNNLTQKDILSYEKDMKLKYYSTEEYLEYLNKLTEKTSFELELTFSRFFSKKEKLNILYFGNKSEVYKNGLINFNIDFDIDNDRANKKYDLIIIDHFMEKAYSLDKFVNKIKLLLSNEGFLYINVRIGTGIDILTLWEDSLLYPLEHNKLLSIDGIKILLKENQLALKELNTPGILDIKNIINTKSNNIPRFLNYLDKADNQMAIEEFQTFIQKNLLSSFATIIAKKGEV